MSVAVVTVPLEVILQVVPIVSASIEAFLQAEAPTNKPALLNCPELDDNVTDSFIIVKMSLFSIELLKSTNAIAPAPAINDTKIIPIMNSFIPSMSMFIFYLYPSSFLLLTK